MKLTNVRHRVDCAFVLTTPASLRLPGDDSLIIRAIGTPPQACEPDTILQMFSLRDAVDARCLQGSISCADAMARFEALTKLVPERELSAVHKTLLVTTKELLAGVRDGRFPAKDAIELLKSFTTEAAKYIACPLVQLDRPILLPPRNELQFVARGASQIDQRLTVHIVGSCAFYLGD